MSAPPNAEYKRVEQALSLLVNASRVSPVLREAVATVEAELRQRRAGSVPRSSLVQVGWLHDGETLTGWRADDTDRCQPVYVIREDTPMPDAHDAAVEAMAEALDSGGEYRCGVCGERDLYHDANYADAARRALSALVRSEAVREALVEAAYEALGGWFDDDDKRRIVSHHANAAILAALAAARG